MPSSRVKEEPGSNGSESGRGESASANQRATQFRRARSRATRACEVCHSRKVRCDVMIHQPCTNCIAFGCECRIPENRSRKSGSSAGRESSSPNRSGAAEADTSSSAPGSAANAAPTSSGIIDTKGDRQGEVSFLGATSHFNLIAPDANDQTTYARLIEQLLGTSSVLGQLDQEDITVLKIRGAFLLPAQDVSDALVETFFDKIHPALPVINKTKFLKQYYSRDRQPPLLLKQALFCAASRACQHPALLDSNGLPEVATLTFYKRARALFEVDYETDRVVSVTAALLLSLSVDGPEQIKHNGYYWSRMAITLAQSIGLHLWVSAPQRSEIGARMCKRIFWSMFVRDRTTAVAYGRPMMLNLEDSDMPMIVAEDFDESEPGAPSKYAPIQEHVQYFISLVKLNEIMGMVQRQQYTVGAERMQMLDRMPDVSQCDIALASWINHLPPSLRYSIREVENHKVLQANLYLAYYTVLCLAHRPQVVHFSKSRGEYPSWGIAFQAAHMIVRILENIRKHKEMHLMPSFTVYVCFSAVILLFYQSETSHTEVVASAKAALANLMLSLDELAKYSSTAQRIAKLSGYIKNNTETKSRFLRSFRKRKRGETELMNSEREVLEQVGAKPGTELPSNRNEVLIREPSAETPESLLPTGTTPRFESNSPRASPGYESRLDSVQGLAMVTQQPAPAQEVFQPEHLFPEAPGSANSSTDVAKEFFMPLSGVSDDLMDAFNVSEDTGGHSSDDNVGEAPDTLSMGDWYNFLMSNPKVGDQ